MGIHRALLFSGFVGSLFTGCAIESERNTSGAPHGGPLFSLSEEAGAVSAIGLRSRDVTLNTALLATEISPLDTPEDNLILNLFEDVQVEATRTRWTHLPNGGWSWHGVIVDDSLSEVTLVQNHGVVSGNVRTENGTYQIRSNALGGLRIEQVDLSLLPGDEEIPVADDFDSADGESTASGTARADGDALIDVLVVYTQAALDGAGSAAAIESEIMLAMAETNEGYAQSNVSQRVRLTDAVLTTWDESETTFDFYSTLVKATSTTDGSMDEIHAIRDRLGADEVVIIVEGDNSYCGLAWLMTHPSIHFATNAFSVVARSCATGNYSFAHELGHNMGSTHDHKNADSSAYEFSFGLQIPNAAVRTVMAYNCPDTYCRRINRWSNPAQSWEGEALGVTGNGFDAADNRTSLNTTVSIVSAFRDAIDVLEPTAPDILSPVNGTLLTSDTITVLLSDVEADKNVLSIGSTLGGVDLGQFDLGTTTSHTLSGLPEDGRQLYIRAWAQHGSDWVYSEAVYIAHTKELILTETPEITSPSISSLLIDSTVTFKWTASEATQIVLRFGREAADASLGQYGIGTSTAFTVRHLPMDGRAIWVSLYAHINGEWEVTYYRYETQSLTADIDSSH